MLHIYQLSEQLCAVEHKYKKWPVQLWTVFIIKLWELWNSKVFFKLFIKHLCIRKNWLFSPLSKWIHLFGRIREAEREVRS